MKSNDIINNILINDSNNTVNESFIPVLTPVDYKRISEKYTLDEPENIFWLVNQHIPTGYRCPEDRTLSSIEAQIEKQNPLTLAKLTSDDLTKFMNQCNVSNFYSVAGVGPETEIATCFQHLDKLARDNDMYERNGLIYSNVRWVYRECYIRQYFEQSINEKTMEDYNQSEVDGLFSVRDRQFMDFLNYTILYPEKFGPGKIVDDNGNVLSPEPDCSQSQPREEYISDPCTADQKMHPELYECNPVIVLHDACLPEDMRETVKEQLGPFYDWFK